MRHSELVNQVRRPAETSLIDRIGLKEFEARATELASQYGDHFKPTPLISEMAKNGETFYSRFGNEQTEGQAAA